MRSCRKWLPYAVLVCIAGVLAFHASLSSLAARYCPPLSSLALRHLAGMGERALPFVLDLLGTDDPRVRKLGEELLASLENGADWRNADPQMLEKAVARFRAETDPAVKGHLAKVVGASNTSGAVAALSEGAKDPAIRGACAGALAEIAARAPDPHLQEAARQASELTSSAEAGRLVSSTVDVLQGVASPVAGLVDSVVKGASRPATRTSSQE